jgi:hypothetical protein
MSEVNESVNPVDSATQPPVAVPTTDPRDAEIERLRAHNQQLAAEQSKYREERRLAEERAAQAEAQIKKARAGSSRQLDPDQEQRLERFDALQNRVGELETQLKQRDEQMRKDRLKTAAISAFNKGGAINGEHLYEARKHDLVLGEDGQIKALDGGVERTIDQFVSGMKSENSGWDYHFRASGARGMSAVGSSPTPAAGSENPYIAGNLTKIVELEQSDPDLAARFKQQAGG